MHASSDHVTTEGDTLHYEVRGSGTPLLMIPAAAGNGDFYPKVADELADEFQVITYDRRGNGRSTRNVPQNFELHQQARDALAVLHAAGHESAHIFGNSAGAIVALELVRRYPEAVRTAIVHEPPLARFHPDADALQAVFAGIYLQGVTDGVDQAMETFSRAMFSLDMRTVPWGEVITMPFPEFGRAVQESNDFFLHNELLPVTNYEIEPVVLRAHAERIVTTAGVQSLAQHRFYAQTSSQLAAAIGCAYRELPGHHMSFLDAGDAWSDALRGLLD